MSGLLLLCLRQIRVRPLRSLLTLFSVALGVALYTSIDIVNHSTLLSFRSGIEALSGKAQLSIQGGENGFEESILDDAAKLPEGHLGAQVGMYGKPLVAVVARDAVPIRTFPTLSIRMRSTFVV